MADSERRSEMGGKYEPPINSCAACGIPCTGVMCLSCATE